MGASIQSTNMCDCCFHDMCDTSRTMGHRLEVSCSAFQAGAGCPGDCFACHLAGKPTWAGWPPRESTDIYGALSIAFFRINAGGHRSERRCPDKIEIAMWGTCRMPRQPSAATPQPSRRRALCRRRSRYVSSHPRWPGGQLQRRLHKHLARDGAGPGTLARDGMAIFQLLLNEVFGMFKSVCMYLISPECTLEKTRGMQAALVVQAVAKSHLACTLGHAAGVQRNPTSWGVLGGSVVGPTAPPAPGRHPPRGAPPLPPCYAAAGTRR